MEAEAVGLVIETKEEYKAAVDLVFRLKEKGSKIKNIKESVTKPLNEALRNYRALFAPAEERQEKIEEIVKGKILAHKRKVDELARQEELKIANRVEKGTMRLDTAEKKIENIVRVEQTTRGYVGEVQIRKIKKVRITNEANIPREYLVPDMVAIRRDALGGKEIPGVEVFEEEGIAAGKI